MLFNRIMYFLLIVLTIIFNIFFDGYLAFFVFMFVILLPVLSFISLFFLKKQLNIQVSALKPMNTRGNKSVVRIILSTKLKLPSGKARLRICYSNGFTDDAGRDYIYITPSFEVHTVDLLYNSLHSGSLVFTVDEVRVYDFLMLFSLKAKIRDNNSCSITVLPSAGSIAVPSSIRSETAGESNEYSKRFAGDDPSEIFDIRDYREGDRIRRIHRWLSEKYNTIIVKDFGEPISESVLILVDFSENADFSESILDLLYGVINILLKNDIKPCVKWYGAEQGKINEFSSNTVFDVQYFFSILLANSKCESGLLKNYICSGDSGKYSTVIFISSDIGRDILPNLYELAQSVPTIIYEVAEEGSETLDNMRTVPAEYHRLEIPAQQEDKNE